MENAELKREADLLIQQTRLAELLAAYPEWRIGGSYSYDLMCWRDLDIYVRDETHDLRRCFELAYELTARLKAKKSRFTNSLGDDPDGFYWGIKLGDERKGAWKFDLWLLTSASYEEHTAYSARLREQLTPGTRAAILAIKQAYWQRPEFRVTVTSNLIYRAVLEHGVAGLEDFERFRRSNAG